MNKSMQVLSISDVEEFCKLCDWAHEVWLNHLELFDNNKREAELMNSFAGYELERLCIISQEYSLLQIAKLADGDDSKYFRDLQEFVDIVHDEVVGGIYPFNMLAINDVVAFLATIKP